MKAIIQSFSIRKITVPENIQVPSDRNPDQDFREIIRYKQLLDSLNKYDKNMYDSLVTRHPGLSDSIDQAIGKHR